MAEDAAPTSEPFTLGEVARDALGALRADAGTHVAWNLAWLAIAIVSCCLASAVNVAALAGLQIAADPAERGVGTVLGVLLVYAFMLPVGGALFALHQSVTITLVRARLRAAPMKLTDAVRTGLARTPYLALHALGRWCVELLVPVIGASTVGALIQEVLPGGTPDTVRPLVISGMMFTTLIYGVGIRGFIGLSYPCVVAGTSTRRALAESTRLLRGRRWLFIGQRIAELALWVVAWSACLGPLTAATAVGQAQHDPWLTLAMIPLLIGFYGSMLFFLVLDATLETAFYVRVTRPVDIATLAETFA